jgi:hypothetical protein
VGSRSFVPFVFGADLVTRTRIFPEGDDVRLGLPACSDASEVATWSSVTRPACHSSGQSLRL